MKEIEEVDLQSKSPVDDYIATLTPPQRSEFERIQNIIKQVVPSVEQRMSYAMPAYMYKGKPVLSCIVRKNFLSLYPFSGKVFDKLGDKLSNYERTSGSIHFSVEYPISEPLLREIIIVRMQEIDESGS